MRKAIASCALVPICVWLAACSAIPASDVNVQSDHPSNCACSNTITVQHPVFQSEKHAFTRAYCDCGMNGDYAAAIEQKQLISPSEAAEKAAEDWNACRASGESILRVA